MILKGKKTYLAAAAGLILGLGALMDPAAAKAVADATGVDTATILIVCSLAGIVLRKITAMEK